MCAVIARSRRLPTATPLQQTSPQTEDFAGLARIPVEQALKLSTYGISLDWVYQGRMANLHPHIRTKIRELQSDLIVLGRLRAGAERHRRNAGRRSAIAERGAVGATCNRVRSDASERQMSRSLTRRAVEDW